MAFWIPHVVFSQTRQKTLLQMSAPSLAHVIGRFAWLEGTKPPGSVTTASITEPGRISLLPTNHNQTCPEYWVTLPNFGAIVELFPDTAPAFDTTLVCGTFWARFDFSHVLPLSPNASGACLCRPTQMLGNLSTHYRRHLLLPMTLCHSTLSWIRCGKVLMCGEGGELTTSLGLLLP